MSSFSNNQNEQETINIFEEIQTQKIEDDDTDNFCYKKG